MDIERLLEEMRIDEELEDSIAIAQSAPAREAVESELPADLPQELVRALHRRGIRRLYRHQREAFDLARAGRNVVVATPTASGKSLCFHLPVLGELLSNERSRALYLYPTKALSRDQLASLTQIVDDVAAAGGRSIAGHVYDGDTPPHVRRALREEADFVVTNPYMLHVGVLPHHAKWATLFEGLRYVVIDELHTLSGVFGSHVANVLRRLRRIAAHYGSKPRFLLASATIRNPRQLAEKLVGDEVSLVDRDGAPHGRRLFALVQPPVVHRQLGLRRPAVEHTLHLARHVLGSGLHSIFFCGTRNGVEVLLKYLKDLARDLKLEDSAIQGYRGGYLPLVRRSIEEGLRNGKVRCVVATNALELGIDIGSLDVCVLVGYPGSVSATFQRAGRAGRRDRASLTLMVHRSIATDQYLHRHPEYLFGSSPEEVVIDPDNLVIRASHLKCAAFELPFTSGEKFGGTDEGDTLELLDYLAEAKILTRVRDRFHWASRSFPAESVSLDTGDVDNFVIFDAETRVPIAEIDRPSASTMAHPEAIYQLRGEQYFVESMDYEGRRVIARKVDVDYFTEAQVDAEVRVLQLDRERPLGLARLHFGELSVRKNTTMYKKLRFYTRENIGAGDIHLPEEILDTEGLALVIPNELDDAQLVLHDGAALQALADLLRKVAPLWVRCNAGDLGVSAERCSAHFDRPTLYLWDEVPGGVGLCERAFEVMTPVIEAMLEVVAHCPCEQGCPACVGPSLAQGRREKSAVVGLLSALIGKGNLSVDEAAA